MLPLHPKSKSIWLIIIHNTYYCKKVFFYDDIYVQVLNQKRLTAPEPASQGSSGRSTPQHLRYIDINKDDEQPGIRHRKPRTFSETLKMLDEDILAELDVK